MSGLSTGAAALLVAAASVGAAPSQEITDPAPPRVAELEAIEAPVARASEELRSYAAPAPLPAGATVEDWPGFLGPRRDGRSMEDGLDLEFGPEGPPLVWELERGEGFAAPAIAGERLVFTHRVGDEVFVDALVAATGERLWRRSWPCDYESRYVKNGGPRSTPQIDGDRVYVHGIEGELRCLELATGRTIWERDTRAEFGVVDGFFGVVSSPAIHEGLLIQLLGSAKAPTLAAFDTTTGRLRWGAGSQWTMDCASPVVATVGGRARVFAVTGGESRPPVGGLLIADAATGALEFEMPFRSRTYASVNASCATVVGERVYLTASYNTGSAGVGLDEEGAWKELWRDRHLGIQFVNPVAVDGRVYVVDGVPDRAGALVCVDPATGEVVSRTDLVWDEERGDRTLERGVGEASLLFVQGHFLCLADNGALLVLAASPDGAEVVAQSTLFEAFHSWTPLALSRGLLYVCQNEPGRLDTPRRLLCYDLRAR